MKEIEQLMGLLVFNKHPKERSPYTTTQGSQWEEVAAEFMKQACGLMGQVVTVLNKNNFRAQFSQQARICD